MLSLEKSEGNLCNCDLITTVKVLCEGTYYLVHALFSNWTICGWNFIFMSLFFPTLFCLPVSLISSGLAQKKKSLFLWFPTVPFLSGHLFQAEQDCSDSISFSFPGSPLSTKLHLLLRYSITAKLVDFLFSSFHENLIKTLLPIF